MLLLHLRVVAWNGTEKGRREGGRTGNVCAGAEIQTHTHTLYSARSQQMVDRGTREGYYFGAPSSLRPGVTPIGPGLIGGAAAPRPNRCRTKSCTAFGCGTSHGSGTGTRQAGV